jgi:hypothetical protein
LLVIPSSRFDPSLRPGHRSAAGKSLIYEYTRKWLTQMAKSLTELRADFQNLRRWRKSVEQAQSYTVKAVITVIVTGLVGAIWLGVKVMLGK